MIGHLGACRLCLDCETVFADAHVVDRAPARCPRCLSRSHVSVKSLIERPDLGRHYHALWVRATSELPWA